MRGNYLLTLTPIGTQCSRTAGLGAGPRAPVLPTHARHQPLQHPCPARWRGRCCRGKCAGHLNKILSTPDFPCLRLSSVPIKEISYSNLLILFFSSIFLSALLLLFSLFLLSALWLFSVSCIRCEALCLIILVCVQKVRAFCQSIS